MREIKYRGLTKKGQMIFGSLVVTDSFVKHMPKQHTKTWIVTSAFGNGGWFNIRCRQYVLPESVGQFTGMVDEDSKPIYEGDVVLCMDDHDRGPEVGTVTFTDCGRWLVVDEDGESEDLCDFNPKIIDNIHQQDIEF